MITPDLPLLTSAVTGWLLLVGKILAALGFMAVANVVMLYAC